jgi:hypothetical protein
MKYRKKLSKFIHVDNYLDKAIAFAHTLDPNYVRDVQKIKQKPYYIPTIEIIEKFQKEGWNLVGVNESRSKNRKISHNYTQLQHPDFNIKSNFGKDEARASLTITNSCSGNSPMELNLGAYRMVCSNGAIGFSKAGESENIQHTQINYQNLDNFVNKVNKNAGLVIDNFSKLKYTMLSNEEMHKLATQAASLRYDSTSDFDPNNLLTINRLEDEGNDLWTVFNRIQENLTKDISNLSWDINLNKQLSALANQYSLAV